MKYFISNASTWFNITSGLASITGLVILAFSDQTNAIIALCLLCLCLIILLICIVRSLSSFIKQENENDHLKVSVFTKYEAIDNTHSIFETYRVVQSKRTVLSEIRQNFKWSGTRLPQVSSKFQEVKSVIQNETDYDYAILKFKRPLLYNETGVVHFRAETDDFDNKAKPYLDHRVDSYINIIHYRIILKYKDNYNKPAKILRKPTKSILSADYEEIGSIQFDEKSKSYEYYLIDPEPGYFYRILWEK